MMNRISLPTMLSAPLLLLAACNQPDQVGTRSQPERTDQETRVETVPDPSKDVPAKTNAKKAHRNDGPRWDEALRKVEATPLPPRFDSAQQELSGLKGLGDEVVGGGSRSQAWMEVAKYLAGLPPRDDNNEQAAITIESIDSYYYSDVKEWFDKLMPSAVERMSKGEAAQPPTGNGWIIHIQLVSQGVTDQPSGGDLPGTVSKILRQLQDDRARKAAVAKEMSHATVVKTESQDDTTRHFLQLAWQPRQTPRK